MPKYQYIALDAKGDERTGLLDAPNENGAIALIREQGMFPTSITPAVPGGGKAAKKSKKGGVPKQAGQGGLQMEIKMPSFMQRVKSKQLTIFTRQMATLIDAGLPLVRSLHVLKRQEKNVMLRDAIAQMADSIESGTTFAEALGQHPRIFNRLYVNMCRAGEIGGILDQVLLRLAEFQEKAQRIKSKVTSAMVYPVVVLIMATAILAFLMVVIVPKFQMIFEELLEGAPLPGLTQFVINTSSALSQNIILTVILIVVAVVLFNLLGRTKKGRYGIDKMKLVAPIFGNLVQKTAIARFSRTLGTLMSSGVPVLQALTIVRDTAGNDVIASAVGSVHDAVKEGENMAPPVESSKQFPPMVVSMIEVGEETGDLPEMLMKVADSYDEEVDDAVAGLTSVIEPILIVLLAVIVGTIVIALFLPLIAIIGNLS